MLENQQNASSYIEINFEIVRYLIHDLLDIIIIRSVYFILVLCSYIFNSKPCTIYLNNIYMNKRG